MDWERWSISPEKKKRGILGTRVHTNQLYLLLMRSLDWGTRETPLTARILITYNKDQ